MLFDRKMRKNKICALACRSGGLVVASLHAQWQFTSLVIYYILRQLQFRQPNGQPWNIYGSLCASEMWIDTPIYLGRWQLIGLPFDFVRVCVFADFKCTPRLVKKTNWVGVYWVVKPIFSSRLNWFYGQVYSPSTISTASHAISKRKRKKPIENQTVYVQLSSIAFPMRRTCG